MTMLELCYKEEFKADLRNEPVHVQRMAEIIWDMALQSVNRHIILIQSGATE